MLFKKSEIKFFLIKATTLAVIVFMCDRLIGSVVGYLYKNQKNGDIARMNYSMDSVSCPIIIIGSSRASHHYDPLIFEKKLNKNSYNTGRDGLKILNNYAVFKSIMKRSKPEILILELDPSEIYFSDESYEKLALMHPYYSYHTEIREICNIKGFFEKYKLISRGYSYNSQLLRVSLGFLGIGKDIGTKTKGYLPLKGILNPSDSFINKENRMKIDSIKLHYLKQLIFDCKSNGVNLFIINSPVYRNVNNSEAALQIVKTISRELNIHFWNYAEDTSISNRLELFKDHIHLNDSGAELFSDLVAQRIFECMSNTTKYE